MSHVKLFKHYIPAPLLLLGVFEGLALFISLLLGYSLRFGSIDAWYVDAGVLPGALIYAAVMLACTTAMGVYGAGLRDGNGAMAVRTLVAYCLLGCAVLTVFYYLLPGFFLGRGVLAIAIVMSLILVIPIRWFLLRLVDAESLRASILVLGVGDRARRLHNDLSNSHAGVAKIAAFIKTEPDAPVLVEGKVIPHDGSLVKLAERYNANELVVALDDRRGGAKTLPLTELFECKMHGLQVSESIAVTERELGIIQLDDIKPGWLVFSPGFYSSVFWCGVKRVCDIIFAAMILLLTWPLMLLVSLAVMLETGRPIIYKQTRVGLEGRTFNIYKFRSMRIDAEKEGKAVWASANDSRVTRVGAVIRNTRLDELPQLINVLKGDMSIVGPRPERPEFVEDLKSALPYYGERHHAKPGLMGWAQLNYPYGASVDDAANKLRYDLYYVKNRSLLLDLIIIVQTVQVVLLGIGVH